MSPQQIQEILFNCENILRSILEMPDFQLIESAEDFHTSNDLTLGDAIEAIAEVRQAITDWAIRNVVTGEE